MASPDMFPNVSFSDVNAAAAPSKEEAGGAGGGGKAVFGLDAASGAARLSLVRTGAEQATMEIDLSDAQVHAAISLIWGSSGSALWWFGEVRACHCCAFGE